MSAITLPGAAILVTGANGFIGGHLCEHLQQAGAQVRGLVRSLPRATWLADQGISLIEGGLDEPAVLARAVDGCAAVIHTAAWTGVPDDPALGEAVNVTGAEAVLQAALTAGVARVIHFSSVAVYGVNASPLIDETAATPLVGQAYPDSKIRAEAVVRRLAAAGLDTVIVRPASTYGPRGTAWTVGPVEQIKSGRLRLLAGGRGLVNLGYIDNVVQGTLQALTAAAAAGQTYNLCDGQAIPFHEFYGYYARMMGISRLPSVPAWAGKLVISPPGRWARRLLGRQATGRWSLHYLQNSSRFAITKAQRELGYAPTIDVAEGMRRTEAWLRQTGVI